MSCPNKAELLNKAEYYGLIRQNTMAQSDSGWKRQNTTA